MLAFAGPLSAQSLACPAEQPLARENVVAFTSWEDYADNRARYGVPSAAGTDIRLLAGAADAAVCSRLHAWLEANTGSPPDRWHRTFYRVGNLYYVALTRVVVPPATVPPGQVWVSMGYNPLYVLDLEFERVAGIAM